MEILHQRGNETPLPPLGFKCECAVPEACASAALPDKDFHFLLQST